MTQTPLKTERPKLEEPNPDSGQPGTKAQLKGQHLAGVKTVTWSLGSQSQTVKESASSDQLVIATVPMGMPIGEGTVHVTSSAGDSNKVPFTFVP